MIQYLQLMWSPSLAGLLDSLSLDSLEGSLGNDKVTHKLWSQQAQKRQGMLLCYTQQTTNCPQWTAFQLDSCICATGQAATPVKHENETVEGQLPSARLPFNKRRDSIALIWTLASPHANYLQFTPNFQFGQATAAQLLQLKCQQSNLTCSILCKLIQCYCTTTEASAPKVLLISFNIFISCLLDFKLKCQFWLQGTLHPALAEYPGQLTRVMITGFIFVARKIIVKY